MQDRVAQRERRRAREERTQIADARAGEPGERIARAPRMGRGGAEPQSSISERIDVRLDVEPGSGAGLVGDAALTFGQAPLAPSERRDLRIGAEREGIERPLER